MVDRSARDQAAAAIEAYLDDQLTAFELDEKLALATSDILVTQVAALLWLHYDDCKDHHAVLTPQQWHLFQRLLLLLKSEAVLNAAPQPMRRWSWTWERKLACGATILYLSLACLIGWSAWLYLLSLACLLLVRFIEASLQRREVATSPPQAQVALFPLASWRELRRIRQATPQFIKRPYRREIRQRRVRSEWAENFHRGFAGLFFSPLLLLSYAFPDRRHGPDASWALK